MFKNDGKMLHSPILPKKVQMRKILSQHSEPMYENMGSLKKALLSLQIGLDLSDEWSNIYSRIQKTSLEHLGNFRTISNL